MFDLNSPTNPGSLRPFFMEDLLETWRNKAKYNLGESGHRPRALDDLLRLTGYEPSRFLEFVLGPTVLRDSSNRGSLRLRELVARMHHGAHPDNVLITTGTSEALFLYFHVNRFKKIALLAPAFQALYEVPKSLGAKVVVLPVEFDESGQPQKNWDNWKEILLAEQPECLVFNHPHNPTGLVFDKEELAELQLFCGDNDISLLGDEHYRFLNSEKFGLGPTLFIQNGKTTVTGSFIKCTGTPGLRIGWCVGPSELISKMRSLKDYTTHTVCPLVEKVSEVVLQNLECELFRKVHSEWQSNKQALSKWLLRSQNEWRGSAPQGGLVTCLFPMQGQSTPLFESQMQALLAAGVFLLPLSTMEFPIQGSLNNPWNFGFRLGLGAEPEQFELGLQWMSSPKIVSNS